MNIVIVGAGDVGTHLAVTFSKLDYTVILIDLDSAKLETAARDLDVITRCGSGSDWVLLESLREFNPDLFLGMSDNDELNIVACTIAKNLGYPITIARIKNDRFFEPGLNFEQMFSIDHLIGPEILTAKDISSHILTSNAMVSKPFHYGPLQIRTIKIPQSWDQNSLFFKNRKTHELFSKISIALIFRPSSEKKFLFPTPDLMLHPDDIILCIGSKEALKELIQNLGIQQTPVHSVVIGGGSRVGVQLAKILQNEKIKTWILEKDVKKCYDLAQILPYVTIINHNMNDFHYLHMEKIVNADVFVACTSHDETNVFAALAFKELNCPKAIVTLADQNFIPLLYRLKIEHVFSPKLFPVIKILSLAKQKKITILYSFFEEQIHIIEAKINENSLSIRVPLKDLKKALPEDSYIGVIKRKENYFFPQEEDMLLPEDAIIIISTTSSLKEFEKLI